MTNQRWAGGEQARVLAEQRLAGCGGGPSNMRRRPAASAEETEPSAVVESPMVAGVEQDAEQEACTL